MAGLVLHRERGGRRSRRNRLMADINVTPFVDVMLVLLIVFMVTAPLLTVGIPVDLPKAGGQNIATPQAPLIVTVTADDTVYLQETPVALAELAQKLTAITEANHEARIYVRGYAGSQYGQIAAVMASIQSAGFTRVALQTDPLDGRSQ